ncbi:hypothetical protein H1230_17785 [Paenibacillus sp. 19GGS1-52]|uniref:hypothetical protein n=1 Tax=Paenibacillus sp. 19GGS1-52 TaxID=2758563 RepID=UPI001EFA85F8|nr:hypothetical protein [Paenibacillus sp. 19GGS1-52]ULO04980.1 hypothetical protein H1230_17785 [Paenibacillus sp. 19GGS1-52]
MKLKMGRERQAADTAKKKLRLLGGRVGRGTRAKYAAEWQTPLQLNGFAVFLICIGAVGPLY